MIWCTIRQMSIDTVDNWLMANLLSVNNNYKLCELVSTNDTKAACFASGWRQPRRLFNMMSEISGLVVNHVGWSFKFMTRSFINIIYIPEREWRSSPVSTSYKLAVRSQEAVTACSPPGSQSAAITTLVCPVSSHDGVRNEGAFSISSHSPSPPSTSSSEELAF